MDDIRKDEVLEQEVIEEDPAAEEVQENLDDHANDNNVDFAEIVGRIDALTERLDAFEKWVNEAIGGVDKTEMETAEAVDDDGTDYPAEEADREFYERQKRYLAEGGY